MEDYSPKEKKKGQNHAWKKKHFLNLLKKKVTQNKNEKKSEVHKVIKTKKIACTEKKNKDYFSPLKTLNNNQKPSFSKTMGFCCQWNIIHQLQKKKTQKVQKKKKQVCTKIPNFVSLLTKQICTKTINKKKKQ